MTRKKNVLGVLALSAAEKNGRWERTNRET